MIVNTDSVLLDSLKKITQEFCYDYPNIDNAGPLGQLYALEQSYRGISAACDDLHDVIEKLRIICGMTKEEVANLFDFSISIGNKEE